MLHSELFGSKHILSPNNSYQDNHNGDHEKNMNKTAHGGGSDESQKPQCDQNSSDSL
jgi:hypothetical protein